MLGPIQNQPPIQNTPFDPQPPQGAGKLETYLMGLGDTLIKGALNNTPSDVLAQNITNEAPNELGFTLPEVLGPLGNILKTIVTIYSKHLKDNGGNKEEAYQNTQDSISQSMMPQENFDSSEKSTFSFKKTWECLKDKGEDMLEQTPDCAEEIKKKSIPGIIKECGPIAVDAGICIWEGKQ